MKKKFTSAHTHTHVVAKYTHTGIAVEKDKLTGRQPLHKATQSERKEKEETSFEDISVDVSFRSQTELSLTLVRSFVRSFALSLVCLET